MEIRKMSSRKVGVGGLATLYIWALQITSLNLGCVWGIGEACKETGTDKFDWLPGGEELGEELSKMSFNFLLNAIPYKLLIGWL